jgi:hypothetical protein
MTPSWFGINTNFGRYAKNPDAIRASGPFHPVRPMGYFIGRPDSGETFVAKSRVTSLYGGGREVDGSPIASLLCKHAWLCAQAAVLGIDRTVQRPLGPTAAYPAVGPFFRLQHNARLVAA